MNFIRVSMLLSILGASLNLGAMPLLPEFSKVDSFTKLKVYKVKVQTLEHARSNVLQTYLTNNNLTSAESVSFEKGLSPFVAYANGHEAIWGFANCFHSAIASVTTSYWPQRFMSTEEMKCQLKNYANPVSDWQFGDVAVLYLEGMPVHAMTYLGWNKFNSNEHFVFSKLGYEMGTRYLVNTLKDVMAIYGSTDVRFFRLKSLNIPDPANAKDSACESEYLQSKDFGLVDDFG